MHTESSSLTNQPTDACETITIHDVYGETTIRRLLTKDGSNPCQARVSNSILFFY